MGVVCFSNGVFIECLHIYRASWFAGFCRAVTIRWHQVTGSFTGTGSRTPSFTSLSREALTSCCQCRGTGMGLCTATAVAFGSTCSSSGGPSMRGSVWHSHVLNVLERYLSSSHVWRAALLSSVAGNGRAVGTGGGLVHVGQEQSHFLLCESSMAMLIDMGGCIADPICGKLLGTMPNTTQASRFK